VSSKETCGGDCGRILNLQINVKKEPLRLYFDQHTQKTWFILYYVGVGQRQSRVSKKYVTQLQCKMVPIFQNICTSLLHVKP
jgi:hypothetical protein